MEVLNSADRKRSHLGGGILSMHECNAQPLSTEEHGETGRRPKIWKYRQGSRAFQNEQESGFFWPAQPRRYMSDESTTVNE